MTHPDMIAFHELEPLGVVTEICDDGSAWVSMETAQAIAHAFSCLFDEYLLRHERVKAAMHPPPDWPRDFWGTP